MKSRLKKVFICLIIFISSFIGNISTVFGAERKMSEDYRTFSQLDYSYGGRENIMLGDSIASLSGYGCLLVSITINMAYANPDLRSFSKWNPQIASTVFPFSYNGSLTSYVTSFDKTFKYVEGYSYRGGPLSKTAAEEKIKKAFSEGYYVTIEACPPTGGTHFSAVIMNKDGSLRVQNSARFNYSDGSSTGDSNDINDWYSRGIRQIVVWEGKVPSTESMKTDSKPIPKDNTTNMTPTERIKMENEILGMINTDSQFITDDAARVILPSKDSLSQHEQKSLESIEENMGMTKIEGTSIAIRIVSFAGLFILVYGVLMIVCYLFDTSNFMFEISLLTIITLGRVKIWDENLGISKGYHKDSKVLYVDGMLLFKRVVVLWIIGFLIVSGKVMEFIISLLEWTGIF